MRNSFRCEYIGTKMKYKRWLIFRAMHGNMWKKLEQKGGVVPNNALIFDGTEMRIFAFLFMLLCKLKWSVVKRRYRSHWWQVLSEFCFYINYANLQELCIFCKGKLLVPSITVLCGHSMFWKNRTKIYLNWIPVKKSPDI